jgi:hypothetical protein
MNRRIWSTVISAIFRFQGVLQEPCRTPGDRRNPIRLHRELPAGNGSQGRTAPGEAWGSIGAARVQEREGHHVDSADQLPAIIPEFQRRCCLWGYSHSVFTTGDGIPAGAKIEFLVGTRNEYEAEQGRKKHSGGLLAPAEPIMPAV